MLYIVDSTKALKPFNPLVFLAIFGQNWNVDFLISLSLSLSSFPNTTSLSTTSENYPLSRDDSLVVFLRYEPYLSVLPHNQHSLNIEISFSSFPTNPWRMRFLDLIFSCRIVQNIYYYCYYYYYYYYYSYCCCYYLKIL